MTTLHLIGAGGHGRVVADVVSSCNPGWRIVWHDDAWQTLENKPPVCDVRSLEELWKATERLRVFVAIGSAAIRIELLERLIECGHDVLTLVHRSAVNSPFARLDTGTLLMAGAIVQTGAVLGTGVIVNTAASVDHDCSLAAGVHIAPGAHLAGDVSVGRESWIGAGAVIREGVNVGSGVMIGAGAVVVSDVPDDAVMVGNPARRLRRGHT